MMPKIQTRRPTKHTPWTAGQVWETFVKDEHECWWDHLFRFTPTEFFDTLVPALRLPEVFRSGDGYVPRGREGGGGRDGQQHAYLSLLITAPSDPPPQAFGGGTSGHSHASCQAVQPTYPKTRHGALVPARQDTIITLYQLRHSTHLHHLRVHSGLRHRPPPS